MPPRVAVVLPARYHSTRFPGKPLALVAGTPLIEWVHRRASEINGVAQLVVATDHHDIANTVKAFGGEVVMTSGEHATGTDRVAEVARVLDADLIVNLQGDEPLFPVALVEEMIAAFNTDRVPDIVTAAHAITDREEVDNANVVKVVMDRSGKALYFSRSPIPSVAAAHGDDKSDVVAAAHGDDKSDVVAAAHGDDKSDAVHYRHVGIYVFHKESLLKFTDLPQTPLEKSEQLEQLRALENGMTIQVVKTQYTTVGVDVPGDIKNVEKALSI